MPPNWLSGIICQKCSIQSGMRTRLQKLTEYLTICLLFHFLVLVIRFWTSLNFSFITLFILIEQAWRGNSLLCRFPVSTYWHRSESIRRNCGKAHSFCFLPERVLQVVTEQNGFHFFLLSEDQVFWLSFIMHDSWFMNSLIFPVPTL